jgi:subtilisin family serine protease
MSTDDHRPPDRPRGGYDPETRSRQRGDQARQMQRGLNAEANRGRRVARSTVRIHPDDNPVDFEYFYLDTVLTTRSADADVVAQLIAQRRPELRPQRLEDEPVPGVTTFTIAGLTDVVSLCEELDELRPGIAMPDHVVHVTPTGCCPATEPVPAHQGPRPGPTTDVDAGDGVSVVVVDSGRQPSVEAHFAWLSGITGTPEDAVSSGHYVGHGTFVCGVLRTQAPKAAIDVNALHFVAGAVVESDLARQLWSAVHDDRPQIISMSAGTTTRKGYPPIALAVVCEQLPAAGILLVAAAGNDTSDEHFFPAYFSHEDPSIGQTANPNVVSVGALDPDRRLAWYSNHTWPKVYAQGSAMVNAYPNGTYHYRESPMAGVVPDAQFSDWLASWDGTSFATPLVAGLVAARMTSHAETAPTAWTALYDKAKSQRGLDSGPSLFPGDAA